MAKLNTQESVVDYLKSQGQDSSYSARKELATNMGITNYTGSETQNIKLLNMLKNDSNSSKNEPVVNNNNNNKNNNPDKDLPLGVTQEQYDKTQEEFKPSEMVNQYDKEAEDIRSDLKDLVGTDDIISDDVMDALNSSFTIPSAVVEADMWLSGQLEKIQSGKTSYSDDVKAMLDKIMNREKFSYDVDKDPLFQQALASAMNSGKQAMQDTIGQASALTGGYGSTYATSAGNQAYNAFIEDAYDNLPQYYQMAMEAYQMEGDEMYRQFGMLSELDDKEFNRNVTAYDATYQHRNQMYNEAYTQFRDSKSDAYAMANLQLNEHGQRVNDMYNLYSATSNQADKMYEREYNSWADSINNAWKEIELYNSDAWADKNFDEGVRQYEQNFAEQKRQHDQQMSYNWASLNAKGNSGSNGSGFNFDFNGDGVIDSVDVLKAMDSPGVKSFQASILTPNEFNSRKNTQSKRYDNYDQYVMDKIEEWSNKKQISEYETEYLLGYYFSK